MSYDPDVASGYQDADLEMLELEDAGRDAANGVCSICEDALDPTAPRWANHQWPVWSKLGRRLTAEEMADMVGPVHPDLPYHVQCMRDRGMQ